MKKKFEKPTLESSEFVVAARLEGSGSLGSGHSNGMSTGCIMGANNGPNACVPPSSPNSGVGNSSC